MIGLNEDTLGLPDVYKHFKGNVYEVFGLALSQDYKGEKSHKVGQVLHTETEEYVDVYVKGSLLVVNHEESLMIYRREGDDSLWFGRPLDSFTGKKEIDGEFVDRFTKIKSGLSG